MTESDDPPGRGCHEPAFEQAPMRHHSASNHVTRLQDDMALEGYRSIVNIDRSPACIERMQRLNTKKQCTYCALDCRSMGTFSDSSFASIVAKGTLDALLCGEHACASATGALMEMHRVLRPKGRLVCVSSGPPRARMHHLNDETLTWTVAVYTVTIPTLDDAAAAENGDRSVSVAIRGPYHDAASWVALELQDDLAFVYVCTKPPLLDAVG